METNIDTFSECSEINDFLRAGSEREARNKLIQLVDYHFRNEFKHPPYLNQLIRDTGLYPYLDEDTSSWQERFLSEAFKVDAGDKEERVLHREQSDVLRRLLAGESIAVSAPTSFGKSFIVDAFIATKKPMNAMIIVPTIALMDEVRRRLHRKFGREYKVITTTGATLADKNLFIFPQERAVAYADVLENLDILVVDEFYKASSEFDKNRSPALLRAILKLGRISKQRYYLAPNISSLAENLA
ncbi:DEAD/DEAH box helicase [Luteolibacter algae]|uniref:DEAD/DEAH box helicase n=1 Tax=Luteolibacter algae TaxID=454151 RepID=A0ABW5DBZ9_9BACT